MRRIAIIMAGAALALSLVVPAVAAEAHGRGSHRGDRHGHYDGRDRHHRGGRCYGCDGPGSRCDRYGCGYAYGYPYYYGGYYGGGYGCNFDYPCGPPYQYDCTRYRTPDGQAAQDPQCQYNQRCDCYYHSSQPPPQGGAQPGPDQNARPAPPDQSAQPAPDQSNTEPTPTPPPSQGGQEPRPY